MTSEGISTGLLGRIRSPRDVHALDVPQLEQLAAELRQAIINTVSQNGGHLAPSLGVVELTLAMLSSFDFEEDKVVWDVGHQAYAWKLLTGRSDTFHTLRTKDGVSGFPKMSESPYDHFGVGHSSTSISAALGMAVARDLAGKKHEVMAVIGDGSMTAGLAFEGLNQAGHMDRKLLVILNDNEMSISRNVGAMSHFLSRNLSSRWVRRFKKDLETVLNSVPGIGEEMLNYAKRSEHSLKSFFTPGMLFEAFHFNYMGPVDGHNIKELQKAFKLCKDLDEPVLLHVMTKKGKGYEPAESNPTHFHGVGRFEPETGQAKKFAALSNLPSYTDVFGSTLCRMARQDSRIMAITAAMPEGTGTACFAEQFPERFVDVGICEQHAVTFAAGLATQGLRPVVAIYSTFLQRSYDQIVHDVCLQNLPVLFCIDRGGLVGEDGPTHHGAFDLSYLRHIPNLVVLVPGNEAELQDCMATAFAHDGPVAIRYPRGAGYGVPLKPEPEVFPVGTGVVLEKGEKVAVIAVGSRVQPSLEVSREVAEETGVQVTIFNSRCVKPLPEEQLLELAATHDKLLLIEENALVGGFTSGVLELLSDRNALGGKVVKRLGIPDKFVEHGKQKELRAMLGIDKQGIRKALLELLA
ncbi:1-deoxy-D-xylulose-5-phosphate synthase [Desulfovibrio mangrovi]|uniref:1-deoxy-D-xylulose-5-phosphate synthase n=1 Tax=Desulfovibrio mangrovi TaxID=2976983 RepID=UPI0022475D39|nr:1-deoxy-D-xylulose-5-phosphate synthase [Desulfovibrio mangrovi]UZP68642.1 1-deoxy-D-xylulose-5-phosphate synthase [Desulfovibrio mangrovi]